MQRMNEMRRRMPLTFILGVLLLCSSCQGSVNTSSTYIQTPNQSASTTFESMASTVQSSIATSDPNNVGNLEMTFTTVQGTTNTVGPASSVDNAAKPTTKQTELNITSVPQDHIVSNKMNMAQNNIFYASSVASPTDIKKSFSEHPKGVSEASKNSGQGSSVFWGLLLTGLLLAAALIGGHVWKNHRGTKTKGVPLAEESRLTDEENQGNTLVSVAPLNPPESQEKPNQNGESLESVKTQNPPISTTTTTTTNGHSATKADTEL